MNKKVLVVSPHPDDETLGCGGSILKHKAAGDEIYWLIMTKISAESGYEVNCVEQREKEIELVRREFGFNDSFSMGFPAARLDTIKRQDLIESVSAVVTEVEPTVVYLPNRNDVHSDHTVTFDVVISSIKTFRAPFIQKVFMYEVVSETEFSPALWGWCFNPNSFSDISDFFDKKIAITDIYGSEIGDHPFPRSKENIKALAIFRGATANVRYAESFTLLKEIW
jgi:LmbE family N-acetylglucosaminyl deacetylase